jgi:hypothetical protein
VRSVSTKNAMIVSTEAGGEGVLRAGGSADLRRQAPRLQGQLSQVQRPEGHGEDRAAQ